MRIAYILLSNGLEYDDRIRKEIFMLRELLDEVDFKIFAFSGDDNHSETGTLSYNVPYEFVTVRHRGGKKKNIITMLLKEYSFYSQVRERVKDYDLLWCCDEQPFFFPLFSKKTIIWDLHEIPHPIIGSFIKNMVFRRCERRSKWILHANYERLEYLIQQHIVKQPQKHLVLRNYPDQIWLDNGNQKNQIFKQFRSWLGKDEYVYIQGIGLRGRYPWETLSSLMEVHRIKVAVIGSVPDEVKKRVKNTYPDSNDFIFYTGKLAQLDTAPFLAHCKFSMVFYETEKPNNRLCEPNRMFQCLGMGKPVIVGCNMPMRSIVEKYGNGIVLESDGKRVDEIIEGIRRMLDSYDFYHQLASSVKGEFCWESQRSVFEKIFFDRC